MEDECGDIPMVLVQNKIDLMTQAHMSNYEVEAVAMDCGMKVYKTSVKEDLNVDLVFQHLAENYVKKVLCIYLKIRCVDRVSNQLNFQSFFFYAFL